MVTEELWETLMIVLDRRRATGNALVHAKLPKESVRTILTGHQDNAEFALAMCPTEPFVLSGGKDKLVVLWGIQDHISSLASDPGSAKSPGSGGASTKNAAKAGGGTDKPVDSPTIGPRGTYQGHGETVEDVQFCPSSAQEFCSVGDDSCLILWDARTGSSPVLKVLNFLLL
ncbi:hypothetical protein HYC85_003664 [Camellia sinensis]|uniref:Uncharacterized protein n=1 Tax=Camellia sinensis TaxID=4442 RepID=A0A7J7HUW7_CAMSI|nr:hypothetical protein HYC85_003664 [Camellia sinensis]